MEIAESASSVTGIDSGNGGFNWKGKDPSFKDQFGTLSVTYEYGQNHWLEIYGRTGFFKGVERFNRVCNKRGRCKIHGP